MKYVPKGTKLYILNLETNWWKPITIKIDYQLDEECSDPREHGWNVKGFTVYRNGLFYVAIEDGTEIVKENNPS